MLWSVLLFGLLLGVQHALEADHVAAVAALATRARSVRGAVSVASWWGIGHAATLFVFGAILVALGATLPPALERAFELAVGLLLVLLGADVLRRARRRGVHFHVHEHGPDLRHLHGHSHAGESRHEIHEHRHALPPILVGCVHGLAGSAALILLSLRTMRTPAQALLYLATFGAGTILGMVLFAVLLFVPIRVSARRLERASRTFEVAIGAGSLAIGAWVVVRVAAF
ncbi:MAG: sulfite exporter TauE/SafE family protein [Deltaproteobacteria bacterium]|nr:sulfite exporter TauE/SafE family protein [Deltaproteobacteria bacterium]